MTLRRQLLLVSLLLLALPWAGCQFTREIEGAMRQGQENALFATADAIASLAVAEYGAVFAPEGVARGAAQDNAVYAFPTEQPLIVDGYPDGWEDTLGIEFSAGKGDRHALNVRARTRAGTLYLMLRVIDDEVRYHNPALPAPLNGDRLVLRLGTDLRPRDYTILTAAPGSVRARPVSRSARSDEASRIQGFWQDSTEGYTLELELPVALAEGFLGLAVVDDAQQARFAGNFDPSTRDVPPRLVTRPPLAEQLLAPFATKARQVLLVDRHGWLLAATSSAPDTASRGSPETFWLLQLLYRYLLAQDELAPPPTANRAGKLAGDEVQAAIEGERAGLRYRDPGYGSRTLQSVAVPIVIDQDNAGAVIIRESGETYLSLTDRAFSRMLGYSLLAIGVAAAGLLGYASLLSWRIRRLSRSVDDAIGEDGVVKAGFTPGRSADEIGDLSRHYARLLARIREYNDYLRTLSRKLSHELRTPIAVIKSSLDNLDDAQGGNDPQQNAEQQAEYRARARDGLARLQGILAAMSEANRLEESIRADTLAPTDLAPILRSLWSSYGDLYTQHKLEAALPQTPAMSDIAPDLLVQALDKIVDNAASFCPAGGTITLSLRDAGHDWAIAIDNDGPALAEDSIGQLFDPMVSLRDNGAGDVHLGLGLHIVRLVTEFHRGHVKAENRADGGGVTVTLALPKSSAA
jgi:dedicated sortase system histidine kinase